MTYARRTRFATSNEGPAMKAQPSSTLNLNPIIHDLIRHPR
jgi:hypothetical protein